MADRGGVTVAPLATTFGMVVTQVDDRVRNIVAAIPSASEPSPASIAYLPRGRPAAAQIVTIGGESAHPARSADRRPQSVGSRFRAAPTMLSKGHVS
jgi:hypothetical protein